MSGVVSSRVYWRRRLVVLTVAAVLYAALAHVLTRSSDAGAGRVTAVETAGAPRPTPRPSVRPSGHHPSTHPTNRVTPTPTPTPSPTPLPQPSGTCSDSDVSVVPQVPVALADSDVPLVLVLRTIASPACIWQVSSSHLALKISRGSQEIWSTRQCPAAIQPQQVVVRRDTSTQVSVTWNSKQSDAGCTERTAWAKPGDYDLFAAALGGEPAHVAFTLTVPSPSPTPTPTPTTWPTLSPTAHASATPTSQ